MRISFFTIIVPVFNVEKYLSTCIESIIKQSYKEWELLLINDGSNDKSGDICDEYASKDSRICVFHKKNGGVSSARNLGLDKAKGEWITFVDSDDELLPEALQNYYNAIQSNSKVEILKAGYYKYNEVKNTKQLFSCNYFVVESNKAKIVEILNSNCAYHGFLWNECIKRNLIRDLRFDESICWNEDNLFSYECFLRANTMALLPTPAYLYYIRSSLSLSNVKDPNVVLSTCAEIFNYRMTMLGTSVNEELKSNFQMNYINMFHFSMKLLLSSNKDEDYYRIFRDNVKYKNILISDFAARAFLNSKFNIKISKYAYVICYCLNVVLKKFTR